ncbi:conserved hypothetical protein [Rubrivivax sp. A210]|uniref:imm11 family protein n=1 Tax=Rubrivivax sp. A210 TaxID=2772301 RepID=UPI0019188DEF|nr:DUF1629 domain-containing protein [Rubrivivax sp. A210]CAD5373177.1 conserved hypothetical protein [Rubrivivax sp. A210]
MRYYQLWSNLAEGDAIPGPAPEVPAALTNWVGGVPWAIPVPAPFELTLRQPGRLLDFYYAPIPVMRTDLYQALLAAGIDNLVAYPARITNPLTGEVWIDRVVVNVVGRVEAVDRQRSRGERLSDEFDAGEFFDELVIDESRARGVHMFRLAENLSYWVASERVREVVLAHPHHSGAAFSPLFATPPDGGEGDDEDFEPYDA